MQNKQATEKHVDKFVQQEEPKSAHATPVVEQYVEERKEKAERQAKKEQKNTKSFTTNPWKRLEYVIF